MNDGLILWIIAFLVLVYGLDQKQEARTAKADHNVTIVEKTNVTN